ncbi:hypothetical protein HanPI659440_Chr13g0486001 [Helianthus annuus]|nr:hypothetical protein HanPI659440_Chr13g0486001 [Helianthus annuus]
MLVSVKIKLAGNMQQLKISILSKCCPRATRQSESNWSRPATCVASRDRNVKCRRATRRLVKLEISAETCGLHVSDSRICLGMF